MIRDVGEQEFQAAVVDRSHQVPVVVDFWAEWCGPCRQLSPALEAEAGKRGDDVDLVKIDVDANQALAQSFGVQGIPAVKAFSGGEVVNEFTGAIPPAQVAAFFDALVPSEADRLAESADEGDLRRALELDPRNVKAATGLGRILVARGENAAAAELLEPFEGDFVAAGLAARSALALEDPPDAKLAAAAVLKQPVEIFDELLALASRQSESAGEQAEELDRFQDSLGVSLRDDIAAALGGEVAMALDGPILPEPAWKVILEVYDPDKLVWAMPRMLDAANDKRAAEGMARREWLEEAVGGRTYYGIAGDSPFAMTFDQGYLLVGPNRGVIDRAIRFRQSGYTLASSSRFSKLLPVGGNVNFSALFYQDALELLKPLADKIAAGGLTAAQMEALEELRGQTEPTLAYAYGEEDRIVFAAGGVADLLSTGLPALLGLGGNLGFGHGVGLPVSLPADEPEDHGTVAGGTGGEARNSLRPAA